jgi:hypothetical protein
MIRLTGPEGKLCRASARGQRRQQQRATQYNKVAAEEIYRLRWAAAESVNSCIELSTAKHQRKGARKSVLPLQALFSSSFFPSFPLLLWSLLYFFSCGVLIQAPYSCVARPPWGRHSEWRLRRRDWSEKEGEEGTEGGGGRGGKVLEQSEVGRKKQVGMKTRHLPSIVIEGKQLQQLAGRARWGMRVYDSGNELIAPWKDHLN